MQLKINVIEIQLIENYENISWQECHAAEGKQTCSCFEHRDLYGFEAQLKFLNFFI